VRTRTAPDSDKHMVDQERSRSIPVTEHPTPPPQGAQNVLRGSTDDVTRVAQDLDGHSRPRRHPPTTQAASQSRPTPSCPEASRPSPSHPSRHLEAWEHQYETLEALGRGEHVADEDDTWETTPRNAPLPGRSQWRVIHNREIRPETHHHHRSSVHPGVPQLGRRPRTLL
jgi:hypothetical protein